MIITNQVVKIATTEEKIITKFPGTKPVISFPEEKVNISVTDNIVKTIISQPAVHIKISEEPVKIEIPEGIQGEKGEKGDTGPSGASSSYTYTAGEILGGHRAVIIDNNIAYYADNTNLNHINKPIGISTIASTKGEEITVVFYGEVEADLWNWDITKPIFISQNGVLIQDFTGGGFACVIARPVTSKKIFVNKEKITILA